MHCCGGVVERLHRLGHLGGRARAGAVREGRRGAAGRRRVGDRPGEVVATVAVVSAVRLSTSSSSSPPNAQARNSTSASRPTTAPTPITMRLVSFCVLLDLGLLLVLELAVRLLPLALLGAHEGRRLPARRLVPPGGAPGAANVVGTLAAWRSCACSRRPGRPPAPGATSCPATRSATCSRRRPCATARRSPTSCRRAGSGSTATPPSRRRRSGRRRGRRAARRCREARA